MNPQTDPPATSFVLPTPGQSSSSSSFPSTSNSDTDEAEHITVAKELFPGTGDDAAVANKKKKKQHIAISTFRRICTMRQAWEYPTMVMDCEKPGRPPRAYRAVVARMLCDECDLDTFVLSYDDAYKKWHVEQEMWLDSQFVLQFVQVLYHVKHVRSKLAALSSTLSIPQLVMCSFPEKEWKDGSTIITIDHKPRIVSDTIAVPLYDESSSHFAVMTVIFDGCRIEIYDGFSSFAGISRWIKHAKYVLQKVGLLREHSAGV